MTSGPNIGHGLDVSFGLLSLHGVAKPSYRAFQLLHRLGTERLSVEGSHPTVDAWVVRREHGATVLLTNHALPRHPIGTESVKITLRNAAAPAKAGVTRIDQHHANAKQRWQDLGEPEYLDAAQLTELNDASRLRRADQPLPPNDGKVELEVTMPPLSVASVTLHFPAGPDA